MKTSLVLNKNQIITNIKTIEKYLMGDSDNDFDIMAKYISHGRVFIAYKIDGDFHFAPSRFIGYANNTLEQHRQNPDKHNDTAYYSYSWPFQYIFTRTGRCL